jgi:hypothetical protein
MWNIGLFNIVNTRDRRSTPKPTLQGQNGVRRASGDHFHTAVGQIANRSRNAESERLAGRTPTEPDALHPPRDDVATAELSIAHVDASELAALPRRRARQT